MKKSPILEWSSLIILYALVFLLIYEWLVPIVELTNTGYFNLILFFVAVCLVTNLITIWPAWCNTCIKAMVFLFILLDVYGNLNPASLVTIIAEAFSSIASIFTGDLSGVKDSFKMIIFLSLLWMTAYLVHHWVTIRHSILLFFFLTVFFIASIDSFTEYDATYPIMRIMCIGFFLAGMLFIEKVFLTHHMYPTISRYLKLMLPLLIIIGVSFAFAYYMPKKEAMVDLPAPIEKVDTFVKQFLTPKGKIGYVEDDSRLGGSFEEDDTVLFNVWASTGQYLRVDTKYIYTGKGWERKKGDIYVKSFDYNEKVPLSMKAGDQKYLDLMTVERVTKNYDFIVQPYGLYKMVDEGAGNDFYTEIDTDKIRPTIDGEKTSIPRYSMSYSSPNYLLSDLLNTKMSDLENVDRDLKRYLQLPDTLPKRVAELAAKITEDETSVYKKASAIESYFTVNGFRYSRENIAYPSKNKDYVDQFLFETKVGYCDNFSTAMVVMLRTQGIPARWVKGFSEGTINGEVQGLTKYKVTNNNAHSWVEAYMPGIGWMQFEPTIGYKDFNQIIDDTRKEREQERAKQQEEKRNEEQQQKEQQQEKQQTKEQPKEQVQKEKQTKQAQATSSWWTIGSLIGVGIIILASVILFMSRSKWYPKWLLMRYRRKEQVEIEKAYTDLLKVFAMKGLSKAPAETLQQFAKRIDTHYDCTYMTEFISYYEEAIYGNKPSNVEWDELKESWENLINKVIG